MLRDHRDTRESGVWAVAERQRGEGGERMKRARALQPPRPQGAPVLVDSLRSVLVVNGQAREADSPGLQHSQ